MVCYKANNVTFNKDWCMSVIGKTTCWIVIGFSPNGAMTSSDIFVGWVKNGIPTVTDRHGASSNTYPPLDPEQNIEVLGGFESNGWTMFKFSRQIAACESGYDREIEIKIYHTCSIHFEVFQLYIKERIDLWEPIIQIGNERFVHHIVIFGSGDILEPQQKYIVNHTMLQEMIYPEEAGFSVGGPGDPVYIQLETYYDNPNLISGARDSSGIRFTYTSTLRQNDIGIMLVGCYAYGLELLIPPGAESFTSIGHCNPACLKRGFAASGVDNVTAFSVILHSHLAGKKLRLRHHRNGVELPYLANEENYDFNYQESRYLNPGVTIKNTDYLQMECDYSTKDRTVMTEGGLGTLQEMCESFVLYYPRINLVFCTSTVPQNT
ncbi:DBH-like monooxygenase protein 1 homolog [Styela clava]